MLNARRSNGSKIKARRKRDLAASEWTRLLYGRSSRKKNRAFIGAQKSALTAPARQT